MLHHLEGIKMGLLDTTQAWDDALMSWEGIRDAPAPANRTRGKGIRVMKNHFIERYVTTSHWITPGLLFIPIIAFLVYAARSHQELEWLIVAGCFGLGVVAWTFVEYCLHRFVFHLPPTNIRPIRFVLFVLHGYHHEFPNDRRRLVAPPVMGWPIAVVLTILFWMLFGIYWQALLAGTIAGYLAYDWMHYYTHHARPRSRFGKFMRRFHMEHHYKNASTQYGLSSPIWDFVFGTFRQPASPTATERECLRAEQGGKAE
jgi:sterol desaturase/sphingolipid hydroxylase (fatty acid hydroxylase superfamily)